MSLRLLKHPAPSIAVLALLAGAAPVLAQGNAPFFTAELATPAPEARFAAGGVVWHCEATTCRAVRSAARPLRICTSLRREAGAVVRFSANGAALDEAALARCNGQD